MQYLNVVRSFGQVGRSAAAALALAMLAACGGGGSAGMEAQGSPPASNPVPLPEPVQPPVVAAPLATRIELASDAGDTLGDGASYSYTKANAAITISAGPYTLATSTRQAVHLEVRSNEIWQADFVLPASNGRLQVGRYAVGTVFPDDGTSAAAQWSRMLPFVTAPARRCERDIGSLPANVQVLYTGATIPIGSALGWFEIEQVAYSGEQLTSLSLRFELHCERGQGGFVVQNTQALLHGLVQYRADDPVTMAPAAAPAGLWAPPAGATPASGNYLYLQSEAGDPVGLGSTLTFTPGNAMLSVSEWSVAPWLTVNVFRPDATSWMADFVGPNTLARLQPGYYGSLQGRSGIAGFPSAVGGIRVYGENQCAVEGDPFLTNPIRGWFMVDSVTHADGVLKSIDLRFEQRCLGSNAALRGKLHWAVN